MSEFKGTKGRWIEYDQEPDQATKTLLSVSGYVEDDHEVFTTYGRNLQEVKANAQLISKAPELLEMLEKMVSNWGNREESDMLIHAKQLIQEATTI